MDTMFPSDIRHEPESPPTSDKRKRFPSSLEGSLQSPTPPPKEKLKLFDEEGSVSGKSRIEVSGSESSVSSHVVPGLGSSSSGSDKSTIELPDFGPIYKVSRLGSSISGPDRSTMELPEFVPIMEDDSEEEYSMELPEFVPIMEDDSEEEYSEEEDSEDDEINDERYHKDYRPYGSGPDYPVDRELWKKYHKQIKDSEGFEIDDYPGFCPAAHYKPLVHFKEKEFQYNILKSLGKLAVTHFNENNNKELHFLDIERAVGMPSGGIMYFLTIRAEDPHDADAVKILRGKVLNGVKEPEVLFCKLKGSVTN